MQNTLKLSVTLCGMALLSACGGGGGGAGTLVLENFEGEPIENATFASLETRADELLRQDADLRAGNRGVRRVTGEATYRGIGAFIDDDDYNREKPTREAQDDIVREARILSQARYQVDFADGRWEGELSDFHDEGGSIASENVKITGGRSTNAGGTTFDGQLQGTVTIDGVERRLADTANGLFYFPDGRAIRVGFSDIDATKENAGDAGPNNIKMRAVILAEKQER